MKRRAPEPVEWVSEDPEAGDVDWIDDDPGAVPVGEVATEVAVAEGISFVEAASQLFSALPPTYRSPRTEEPDL